MALYRPDFAVKVGRDIRWILEAKSPAEDLDRHVAQPRSYCTILNGEFLNSNPVQYFVLTNGHSTRLYQWDYNAPLLELSFEDFTDGNQKYDELKKFLDRDAFMSQIRTEPLTMRTSHHLVRGLYTMVPTAADDWPG